MSQSTKKRIKPNTANPCMASSSSAIAGGKGSARRCRGHGGSGSSRRARRTSGERNAGARWDGNDELVSAESEAGLQAGVKENSSLSGSPVS